MCLNDHLHRLVRHLRRLRRLDVSAGDGQSGEVAEVVVISVSFFFLVFLAVQAALWMNAAHVAQAAAEEGNQVARAYGSTPGAGVAAAESFISKMGASELTNVSVSSSLAPGDVSVVSVTGDAESILPFFHRTVTASSVGTLQEFRSSG